MYNFEEREKSLQTAADLNYPQFISNNLKFEPEDAEPFFECDGIRISPRTMVFKEAFEGKKYCQKLSIQNCGKLSAHIRITKATSSAFNIKGLMHGCKLSPGLEIVQYISYQYMRATAVPLSLIPIFINNKRVDYKLKVLLSNVALTAIPQRLDFGTIDVGCSEAVRTFSLCNSGSKGTRFAVDLGNNEIELIVEPCKGIIKAYGTVNFRVECLGTKEGLFNREFWVKCDNPQKIDIQVNIISQQFKSFHPNTTSGFTLINFEKKYFGSSSTKTLVVRNISSSPAVFCVMADIHNTTMSLEKARTENDSFKDFFVVPEEGAMLPNEGTIFSITYRPTYENSFKIQNHLEKVTTCNIKICRVACANLSDVHYKDFGDIEQEEATRNTLEDSMGKAKSDTFNMETAIEEFNSKHLIVGNANQELHKITNAVLPKYVPIILVGEAEEPRITLRPTEFSLQDIEANLLITREVLLTNKSFNLPIVVEYKKVCFVKVEPSRKHLKPLEKFEFLIKILPTNLGRVSTKIRFNLLWHNTPKEENHNCVCIGHYDIPLTFNAVSNPVEQKTEFNTGVIPEYIKEVGYNANNGRFNFPITSSKTTSLNKSKNNTEMVTFTSNRNRRLRPWKNETQSQTNCAKIPRIMDDSRDLLYQLSKSRSNLKHQNYSYYQAYIREEASRLRKLRPTSSKKLDYEISNKNLLLLQYPIETKCSKIQFGKAKKQHGVIPLTPLQLCNIEIFPISVYLGKVAPSSIATAVVTITNNNDFYIEVRLRSRHFQISTPLGESIIIKKQSKLEIPITYQSSPMMGRSMVIVDFIVNNSHSFMSSLIVDVFPKVARCIENEITFVSNQDLCKFINVHNILNVPIDFNWCVSESCFTFFPSRATIPPRCYITCTAQYLHDHAMPSSIGATLKSASGYEQNVNIETIFVSPEVYFKTGDVVFKDISLNIAVERKIVLVNNDAAPVTYSVLNPEPIEGIYITPLNGIVEAYAEEIFVVQVKICACIDFICEVNVEVQTGEIITFLIKGNVIYPNIIFKPEVLRLEKIVADSFTQKEFTIINKSKAKALVEFEFENYPDYSVLAFSHMFKNPIPIHKLELEAYESKQVWLHFKPMGAACYSFYLPFVINDIIGPINVSNPDTLHPHYFMKDDIEYYLQFEEIKILEIPKQLTYINIFSNVGGDILRFSKLNLKFKYFPHPTYSSETKIEFKIWNASNNNCKFCLKTNELAPPFFLLYHKGNEVEIIENSIIGILGPLEWVLFKAEFCPEVPGSYNIKIPIFLKKHSNYQMFNYIHFSGIYPAPLIYAIETCIHFEPVALNCMSEYNLELRTEYHKSHCKMYADCDIYEIDTKISKPLDYIESPFFRKISVRMKFFTKAPKSFKSTIKFYCTCESELNIEVKGCSENSFITTYSFSKIYITWLYDKIIGKSTIVPPYVEALLSTITPRNTNSDFTSTISSISSYQASFDFLFHCNESTFPLFPERGNFSDHARYLVSIKKAVEEWIFQQGFHYKAFLRIPDGIASLPPPNLENPKKGKFPLLYYVELLENLFGPQLRHYIPIRKIPENNKERVKYMFSVYSRAIDFITKLGGFLPHVCPESLLEYNDYVYFINNQNKFQTSGVSQDTAILAEKLLMDNFTFYQTSTQSWLDLLLQTFKVLVLERIKPPNNVYINTEDNDSENPLDDSTLFLKERKFSNFTNDLDIVIKKQLESKLDSDFINESKVINDEHFWNEYKKCITKNSCIFSESETILLFWLEYHFNKSKISLLEVNRFNYNNENLENRTVRFFGRDLSDGIVLIGITITYCPYLLQYLTDIYLNPTTLEERVHNATQIVQTWKKLKFSFIVSPMEIIQPHPVKMIMLVSYLYEVLPNFYPSNKLHLISNLSATVVKNIAIENLNNCRICYNITILNNEQQLAGAPEQIIVAAKEKAKVPLTFFSKFAVHHTIYVIFSGDVPRYRYAKSIVFIVLLDSYLGFETTTITVPMPLYKVIEAEITIRSPYKEPAAYEIYFIKVRPTSITTCNMILVNENNELIVPKRMTSFQKNLVCDESGVGKLRLIFASLTTQSKTFWIIFRDASVGDFIVKFINVVSATFDDYEVVNVTVPKNFHKFRCSCKIDSRKCRRNLIVQIPCFNTFLYNTVIGIMLKITKESDWPFWKKILRSTAGKQFLWSLLSIAKSEFNADILEVLEFGKTFNIESSLNLPRQITIPNVMHLIKHEILLHVEPKKEIPTTGYATFTCLSGLEIRNYKIHFLDET